MTGATVGGFCALLAFDPHSKALTSTMQILLGVVGSVLARDGPDGKGRTPLMGWNTWCTQNQCGTDWCTSAEVLSVAAETPPWQAIGTI